MYSVKYLLPQTWQKTRVLANWMGWFEGAVGQKHRGGVCRSDDPRTVRVQAEVAKASGLDGFIVDWYGPNDDRQNQATIMLMQECERVGLQFCIMFDSGIVKWLPDTTDKTAAMASTIDYAVANFLPSSAYAPLKGKPAAFEFGWAGLGDKLNIQAITSKYSQFTWVSQDSVRAGFAGTFGWVNGFPANNDTPYAYIDRQLNEQGLLVPGVFWQFNDESWRPGQAGKSIWAPDTPARVISNDFGRLWAYSWQATVKKFGDNAPEMIQICTWNDYDERTCIEPFLLAMTGRKLF